MDTERLMKLLPTQRPYRRLRPRRRGSYHPRPPRTPDELAAYLRDHSIRTTGQLKKKRQPNDPTLWDYIKAFGTWVKSLEAAFGKPTPCMEPERPTSEYLARCVLELNLWRRDDWITAHRQNPAAVPSTYWVRRLFGSHDNLKWLCERMSFSKTLDKYQSLGRRLGRTPTSAECIAHGIDLKAAYKIFEGKRDIDKLLNQLHDKS